MTEWNVGMAVREVYRTYGDRVSVYQKAAVYAEFEGFLAKVIA